MPQQQVEVGCDAGIGPGGYDILPAGFDQQIDGGVKCRLGVVAHHGGDVGLGVEQEFLDIVPAIRGHAGLKTLIGHRHGAGDPPQLLCVDFPKVLLKLHVAGISQSPGKTDHAGLTDIQLLGQLRGRHKTGVGLMIQNEVPDAPAGLGKPGVLHGVSELIHDKSPPVPLVPLKHISRKKATQNRRFRRTGGHLSSQLFMLRRPLHSGHRRPGRFLRTLQVPCPSAGR